MKIFVLNDANYRKILSEAERILRSGGIVISPTDTVYGILGDATKEDVIKNFFEIKQRQKEKAFPIFVKDVASARKYAYISDEKARFLEKVWPGAVTVVFKHKDKLPVVLTGNRDTIGIRIPDYPFLSKILSEIDFPLVQTSANISGKPPAKNVDEIKQYFKKEKAKPDLVIYGGKIDSQASTIFDFTGKEPIVLRTGAVSKEELDRLFSFMR